MLVLSNSDNFSPDSVTTCPDKGVQCSGFPSRFARLWLCSLESLQSAVYSTLRPCECTAVQEQPVVHPTWQPACTIVLQDHSLNVQSVKSLFFISFSHSNRVGANVFFVFQVRALFLFSRCFLWLSFIGCPEFFLNGNLFSILWLALVHRWYHAALVFCLDFDRHSRCAIRGSQEW